jgi:hypothetical protein
MWVESVHQLIVLKELRSEEQSLEAHVVQKSSIDVSVSL